MGLEIVEIALALEEEFGIDVSEAEYAYAYTPGALIEVLCRKLPMTDQPSCQSQQSFHRLRKGLVSVLGIPREKIRLDTRLADLAPNPNSSVWWSRLQESVGARSWPMLVRPPWMRRSILWIMCVFFASSTFGLWLHADLSGLLPGVFIGAALAVLAGVALLMSTSGFKYALPIRIRTVADLIPCAQTAPGIAWTRERVAAKVKEIVVVQLSLKGSEYSESKRFIEDYGAG